MREKTEPDIQGQINEWFSGGIKRKKKKQKERESESDRKERKI